MLRYDERLKPLLAKYPVGTALQKIQIILPASHAKSTAKVQATVALSLGVGPWSRSRSGRLPGAASGYW
jgi:hypothetical protein